MKKTLLFITVLLSLTSILTALSFGQNKVNTVPPEWSTIQTMHFDIYFPKGEDDFGKTAALMSEDIYYYIKAEFKIPILSRIPIIFYGSKTEFQTTNIIYPLLSEGIGGFTEGLRNRVAIPFEGSYAALEEVLAHELTHAYINAMDDRFISTFTSLRPTSFPFWFSEGLPEYLSIGGEDDYNNMFLMDMVINDKISSLQNIDGYLAYRLGESFLSYIANTWGREKVPEYFFALRNSTNLDDATKKVFGMEFLDLESRWNYQLKRDYFPMISNHSIPKESFEQRTFHQKNGSYFNFSPRFSPDGTHYVYYSNAGARYSIWMAGTQGLDKPKKILQGESSAKAEEFYYMRSTLSWFPDNKRIAFSVKTAAGDRIQILDVNREKIVQTLAFDELSAIYEVDVSPDGKQLAFAALNGVQADLYLYNIDSKELTRLTDDCYNEANPRFSPDGQEVAFDSERRINTPTPRYGLFSDLSTDVFTINLATQELKQITAEDYNCTHPFWAEKGKKLVFISNKDKVSNFEIIDLATGNRAELDKTVSGVISGDLSSDDAYLLMANYFDGAWDIYFDDNPLGKLSYAAGHAPKSFKRAEDLLATIDLGRLDYYGKRSRAERKRTNPQRYPNPRRPLVRDFEYTYEDSLRLFPDYAWDDKPDSVASIPIVKPMKARFALEHLWGGMAYSSSSGTFGSVDLGLADLMGNHGIGISLGISGKLKESNLLLSYIYLKQRADYGVGVYNMFDETLYREPLQGQDAYLRYRMQDTGFYLVYRYPFSRFLRVEFDNSLYRAERAWDYLPPENVESETWIRDVYNYKDTVYAPGLTLVHDNSLSGSTGPLVGWRSIYHIRKSFAAKEMDYLTNYLDFRTYSLFSKRYSVAFRLNGGISTGKTPERFSLGGYYGVRALEYDLEGYKKALTSLELRFPFFDYIAMAFPIPLAFGGIRGSVFADAGSVWDDNQAFRGIKDGKLESIKLGYGFGPRFNLGYFVLKFDIAWQSDFVNISKPLYYLSLTDDF
ncbi:MAG: BamA/TamA family outer membrane protein [Candidatus Cloacimonas sp.]|jgi:Tol biopolymer transport system component|nr:BamA/TamA family outer membrane protein [Candidatus Cloacimonas sp.]